MVARLVSVSPALMVMAGWAEVAGVEVDVGRVALMLVMGEVSPGSEGCCVASVTRPTEPPDRAPDPPTGV